MILLDTHAWIWLLAAPDQISERARAAIDAETAPRTVVISAISVWELCMLVKKGRLVIGTQPVAFVNATHRDDRFRIEPVDEVVSRKSVELPDLHNDPADRMLLATAVELGCAIISKDARLRNYEVAQVIW